MRPAVPYFSSISPEISARSALTIRDGVRSGEYGSIPRPVTVRPTSCASAAAAVTPRVGAARAPPMEYSALFSPFFVASSVATASCPEYICRLSCGSR